jgi:hypothetical protein
MANEAFALSPISARASLPSEEDYEAIREAFMETSRGRWFLTEYARRNRNADTSMVLDAVARIEEALAAQKREPPPPPPVEDKRAEMLAAIGSAIARAEETASSALDNLGVDESLAPIRKGARIIREISWRWREIGADGRICDLIDSQVSAIEAGCEQIAGYDPHTALREAFEIIKAGIEAFSDLEAPAAAQVEDVTAEPAPSREQPLSAAGVARDTTRAEAALAAPEDLAAPEEPADIAAAMAEPAELASEADAYNAADEAVLDLVAAEMAAPDPDEAEAIANKPRAHVTEPPLIEPFVVASTPEPVAMLRPSMPAPTLQAVAPIPPAEPSLGATILATGILPRPKPPASDPLAPIRRMSQAEKIAFFS